MIERIQPQTNFPIARLLPDLGDGVTYYVQAVIRNAKTNATLATVNLNSVGSRLYTNTWYSSADSSGLGLYITITTTAYTDSGYTSASQNYSPESDTYIIYDQFHQLQGLATQLSAILGSESNVDYKKIKKIVAEVITEKIKFPEIQEGIDYTPHFKQLTSDLKQLIAEIEMPEMPEYKETDLAPVIKEIKDSEGRIHGRFDSLTPYKETDLSPILQKLEGFDHGALTKKIEDSLNVIHALRENLEKTMPEIGKYFDYVTQNLKGFLYFGNAEDLKSPENKQPRLTREGNLRL